MPIKNPDFDLSDDYRQLALDLDFPEVELEGVTPEEARLRSEAARHTLEAMGKSAPAWIRDYHELRNQGWPWRQAAYIAWASTPKKDRVPENQDELAQQFLGLNSDRAIATWRKRNPAILEVIALKQSAPLYEWRADHFKALVEGAAKAGEDYKFFNHLKLVMEMRGDYVPTAKYFAELKRKISTDPSELSQEEIDMLAAAYEELQKSEGSPASGHSSAVPLQNEDEEGQE